MNFILIKNKKCSCDPDATELNGNLAFAFSGGEIIPVNC